MIAIRKRGKAFHADSLIGEIRLRGSLGTRNQDAARRLVHKLETALSEGAESPIWLELKTVLPPNTFARFAKFLGVKERQHPTWSQLKESYEAFKKQRIKIGKLEESTFERYQDMLGEFELYLAERGLCFLRDIGTPQIEDFKVWRFDRIKKRKHSRGGGGLTLDVAILHGVFAFAVKREMTVRNPVVTEGTPGDNPERGAEPFEPEELLRLRQYAGNDTLSLLVLRWTGFRGSDAVRVTWGEIDLAAKEVRRLTKKRKKRVTVPLHTELLFALEAEREQRKPIPSDPVLINPETGKPMARPALYRRIVALGRRAGVPNAHPHRFRDTFAVDLLLKGASPYDVAKLLGDTIETIEKHYTPFVKELRERVRGILETGVGLEEVARKSSEDRQLASKKLN
jgi:integrase